MKKNIYMNDIIVEEILEQISDGYCDEESIQKAIDSKVQMEQYSLISDLTESIHNLLNVFQKSNILQNVSIEEQFLYKELLENICDVALKGQESLRNVEELENIAHFMRLTEITTTIQ
ncbi:MAG: hypothetical protein ACRCV3_02280 [Desulfovibrionaceae bacterium]